MSYIPTVGDLHMYARSLAGLPHADFQKVVKAAQQVLDSNPEQPLSSHPLAHLQPLLESWYGPWPYTIYNTCKTYNKLHDQLLQVEKELRALPWWRHIIPNLQAYVLKVELTQLQADMLRLHLFLSNNCNRDVLSMDEFTALRQLLVSPPEHRRT